MKSSPKLPVTKAKRTIKNLIRPLRNPWVTRKDLLFVFEEIGLRKGGIVLVHGSMSQLGFVPGGPQTIIRSLSEFLGPSGTIVFPSHSWEQVNSGQRVFDTSSTQGCVGRLAEEFRKMPNAVRSIHPTHSVCAVGPEASRLVDGHQDAPSPCGPGTPYEKIMRSGGQILFLGVGLESNTCFHCVEASADLPWLLQPGSIEFELIDKDGEITHSSFRLHRERIKRRYPETEEWLEDVGVARKLKLGAGRCLLLDGEQFYKLATEKLRQDPDWLLADQTTNH